MFKTKKKKKPNVLDTGSSPLVLISQHVVKRKWFLSHAHALVYNLVSRNHAVKSREK